MCLKVKSVIIVFYYRHYYEVKTFYFVALILFLRDAVQTVGKFNFTVFRPKRDLGGPCSYTTVFSDMKQGRSSSEAHRQAHDTRIV